ncbi:MULTISPECIES: phosphoglucosamine mutase [Haloferax]|uniref:Phosphoglucosamine mutase n=2 Tax=Haloferax TaxID=2251 RepID=A0A6G1Z7E0_9EURY|nr:MULTISPECIES: phosphoglucosamine mutase [Haloferax]KAB1185048.1 phosphoglucosamine mutase [Haloferax sp. CBA1149]MRW82224.1 phosphoglucosamine mutase [Haloferax marinisediminis]
MFGTSGIRGPVGRTVTADLALRIGRAVGCDARTVVVGQDARLSGDVLADAVSAGVRESGADVVRLGVVSTPTVARAVGWLGADAGIGITASHNPASDNGLKLWTPSGRAFDREQTRDIVHRLNRNEVSLAAWDELGEERTWLDGSAQHVDHLVSSFDSFGSFDDVSVVFDLGNGTGRVSVDALYELGATVNTIDGQKDGRFPARKSEPNESTLSALRKTVPVLDADVGLAHDGDADRLVAVDETGEYVPGDYLLALFARDAVSSGQSVAVPIDTSLLVQDVVEKAGGCVTYTPVGDVHIAETVENAGYVFGGEPSGAWIWPDETLAPDGHYAALKLTELLKRNGPLSEQVASLGGDAYTTRRVNLSFENKTQAMDRIARDIHAQYDNVDTIDGIRVDTDDGWFLVRASGTEPLIRITAEARDRTQSDRLFEEARSLVEGARVVA